MMTKCLTWLRTGAMLLATIVLISSCQQDNEPTKETQGSLQLNFSAATINKSGRVQQGECASVLVTIADANGAVVASNKQLTLYAFGEGYLSEPIELATGQYTLTGFVVLNDSNTAVYATPVKGSALAYLVEKPLPISFPIIKNIVSNVDLEVVSVSGNSPKDFGYTTFSFNIVNTFTFSMNVIAQDKSELTEAHIVINAGVKTLYDSFSIKGVTSRIQIRDGYSAYAISVTKDGYLPYADTVTALELKTYATDALIVNLIRNTSDTTSNRALLFNGAEDFIELGNIYDTLQFPVSMSVWVYTETTTAYALPIFDSQDNSLPYNGVTLALMDNASAVVVGYGDGRGYNSSSYRRGKSARVSNLTGRWVHLAANMRGPNDMDVFVDGINVGGVYDGDSQQPIASNYPLDIAKVGTWSANGITYRFKGALDELRIWKRSLSATEIQADMRRKLTGTERGLIGYWSFDEADGNTVFDATPYKFNGVIKGNPKRISGAF